MPTRNNFLPQIPRLPTHAVQGELKPLANVRNIITVGPGKGGVGMSTIAVGLAVGCWIPMFMAPSCR